MFAEELAGNNGRKRAEENRARRRRLKAQQEQAKAVTSITLSSVSLSVPTSDRVVPKPDRIAETSTMRVPIGIQAPKEVTTSNELSSVEVAFQQRQVRADLALRQKASTLMQACFRSYSTRKKLRKQYQDLLSHRLQDIATLRAMLEQKGVTYVPPTATASTFVRQLLFLARVVTNRERNTRTTLEYIEFPTLKRLLEFAVLPGMEGSDEHLDPVLVWVESTEGLQRLVSLMRVLILAVLDKYLPDDCRKVILHFWQVILGATRREPLSMARRNVVHKCRSILLAPSSIVVPFSEPAKESPWSYRNTTLDLIASLRYFVLFTSSGGCPIPTDAVNLREKCISERTRNHFGDCLICLLDIIDASSSDSEKRSLQNRVVSDILTIPLFTWRVPPSLVARLVSPVKTAKVPLLVTLLHAFSDHHIKDLATGNIRGCLPSSDVPLTLCAATMTQTLLANLAQLSRVCTDINGTNLSRLEFDSASFFFDFVACLLHAVPLATFTARESAIEWINDEQGRPKAVVLSSVVLEQCRSLLVDSFVRTLFNSAIDVESLDTDNFLLRKDSDDLKLEKELFEGGSSASALAAREARIDRSKSFWNSSKWAERVSKRFTSLLSNESKPVARSDGNGNSVLRNTSSQAKTLAQGKTSDPVSTGNIRQIYSTSLLFSLCRAYAVVLARWGGGGSGDILTSKPRDDSSGAAETATSKAEPCTLSLLNTLCFATSLVKVTWALIQSDDVIARDVKAAIDVSAGRTPVRAIKISTPAGLLKGPSASRSGVAVLYIFVCTLAHVLIVTDDIEIHDMDRPLPVHQIRRCIQLLKKLLYRACCLDEDASNIHPNYFGLALINASARAMRDLYDRSSRRPLCTPKLWIVSELMEKELRKCRTHEDYVVLLSTPTLKVCPFLVSFKRRLKLFECIITTNRIEIQGVNDGNPFNSNPLKPGIPVRITRGRILEDGLATMNHLGRNLRQRIAVNYYNEAGVREAGVDAGGLFKEFWTDLCSIAFNPNYALFRVTDGAGSCLYPNPSSGAAYGADHIALFEFLGRILGKALYEGITINPRFAHFFLSFLRGDYNFLHMLPDLSTVDPQLYNNLMFLKTYDGDASDLCLTFTVTVDNFGGTKDINLIPKGSEVEVTNHNKQRYIGLVAKYYVVDRVKEQSEAFTRGLWEVIDRSWLQLFNEPELQVLISGSSDDKIDIEDMRAHARYAGGFTPIDRTVLRFWNVIGSLDGKQQANLLRFVTSCERPPPLGFGSMNPPFTIQRVGIMRDGDKLPTAATCFNILKLPTYSSEKVMKERLLYAIESGAGFELT